RDVEERAHLPVPRTRVDVVEERARGVGRVGGVHCPARELPHQPGVDRAEAELALGRALGRPRDVLQQPAQLGAGEVGVEDEARLLAHAGLEAALFQLLAARRRAAVLPDESSMPGAARAAAPEDRRLALVRDAERPDVAAARARPPARLA